MTIKFNAKFGQKFLKTFCGIKWPFSFMNILYNLLLYNTCTRLDRTYNAIILKVPECLEFLHGDVSIWCVWRENMAWTCPVFWPAFGCCPHWKVGWIIFFMFSDFFHLFCLKGSKKMQKMFLKQLLNVIRKSSMCSLFSIQGNLQWIEKTNEP